MNETQNLKEHGMAIDTHRTYVTFGQTHRHEISGVVYDRDCVAVIFSRDAEHGRELAFEYFGREFCFEYPQATWPGHMSRFPRGYIHVN